MATPDFSQIGGTSEDSSKRSYWGKPEGITSLLFLGGLGAVSLYYWNKITFFLIEVTQNTLYLGVLMAVLAFFSLQKLIKQAQCLIGPG